MAAGGEHTCAVLEPNARLKCWGNGEFGQLGYGAPEYRGAAPGEMGDDLPEVDLGPGVEVIKVQLGYAHTCVMLASATSTGSRLKCFGYGRKGRLGRGSNSNVGDAPGQMGEALGEIDLGTTTQPPYGSTDEPAVNTLVDFAVGYHHTCAILQGGRVKCFGSGEYGQLGYGSTNDVGNVPSTMGDALPEVDLGTGLTAASIAAGDSHTCVIIAENRAVKCWGRGNDGQLGQEKTHTVGDEPGEMGNALPFVNLDNRQVKVLAAGHSHTCVILEGLLTVKCWGQGRAGQLGNGKDSAAVGTGAGDMGSGLADIELGEMQALSISLGYRHSCAVVSLPGDSDTKAKCWGDGRSGQLGTESTEFVGDNPDEVGGGIPILSLGTDKDLVSITAAYSHTCALLSPDPKIVKCWGYGWAGRLGYGSTQNVGDRPGTMGDNAAAVDVGRFLGDGSYDRRRHLSQEIGIPSSNVTQRCCPCPRSSPPNLPPQPPPLVFAYTTTRARSDSPGVRIAMIGVIIGIAIGVLLLCCCCCIILAVLYRRRRRLVRSKATLVGYSMDSFDNSSERRAFCDGIVARLEEESSLGVKGEDVNILTLSNIFDAESSGKNASTTDEANAQHQPLVCVEYEVKLTKAKVAKKALARLHSSQFNALHGSLVRAGLEQLASVRVPVEPFLVRDGQHV